MSYFSFLHAADIHIDSPFVGLGKLNPNLAEMLSGASRRAFSKIVDLAIERGVDFLLLAGDLFDTEVQSVSSQWFVSRELRRLDQAGVKTFMVCGNHDPMSDWSEFVSLPDSVYRFSSERVETVEVKRDGKLIATVSGRSFPDQSVSENFAEGFTVPSASPYPIALLHCNVGGVGDHHDYAPCSLGDLTGSNFAYWALGHIHKRQILSTEPYVVYPGIPQGRHIGEVGSQGCYFVEVSEGGESSLSFEPIGEVEFVLRELDCSELQDIAALEERMDELRDAESSFGNSRVVRVILSNISDELSRVVRERGFYEEFLAQCNSQVVLDGDNFVWFSSLVIPSGTAVRQREDLSEFLQLLSESFDRDEELQSSEVEALIPMATRFAKGALRAELLKNGKSAVEIYKRAEQIALDELLKGSV